MDNLLEQLEQWNKNDEFSRCIEAIEAIPEKERGYKLTVLLGRAYSNLAVLGDHKAHGDDDEVDKELRSPPRAPCLPPSPCAKMTRRWLAQLLSAL